MLRLSSFRARIFIILYGGFIKEKRLVHLPAVAFKLAKGVRVRRCKIRVRRVRSLYKKTCTHTRTLRRGDFVVVVVRGAVVCVVSSSNALKCKRSKRERGVSPSFSALQTLTSPSELLLSERASARVVRNVRVAPTGRARPLLEQQSAPPCVACAREILPKCRRETLPAAEGAPEGQSRTRNV